MMDKFLTFIGAVMVAIMISVVAAFITGIPVYLLWNSFVPDLFGLEEITYVQSVLLALLVSCFTVNTTSNTSE